MKEYTDEDLQHIKDIIRNDEADKARAELADMHPADIAELYKSLDLDEAEYLFKLLDEETSADVLMELDEDDRLKLISDMPAEEIAQTIDHLDTDDAVDLIQQLDEEDRDMADQLIGDIRFALKELNALEYPTPTRIAMEKNIPLTAKSFNHTGK